MSNALRLFILAAAFTFSHAALAQTTTATDDYSTQNEQDDDFDYGWLGLLGLAGLAGLRKRPEHHDTTRTTAIR
ncbi:MAG TPA: WGxxGxxG family protein [Rubricoccaceae bacterium]